MRRLARCGDNNAEITFVGVLCEFRNIRRGSVRGHNAHFIVYSEFIELCRTAGHNRQVAVAPHYDRNTFHAAHLRCFMGSW